MKKAAALRCDGGRERPGTALPTMQGSEASEAGARARGISGEKVEGGDDATGLDDLRGGTSGNGVAHHAGQRGLEGGGASETERGERSKAVMSNRSR